MKEKVLFLGLILAAVAGLPSAGAAPLGTTFTYQGRLDESGTLANGLYDFNFKLYDSETGGAVIGLPAGLSLNGVTVVNGVFQAPLDFGATAFPGAARWLAISVRTNDPGGTLPYEVLTPRVELRPTPYALRASEAGRADTAASADFATTAGSATTAATATSASVANTVTAGAVNNAGLANNAVNGAKIANGSVVRSLNGLTDALTIAAGLNITLGTSGNTLTISGSGSGGPAWLLGGNGGTTAGVNFLGTTDNQPLEIRVNNQRALRLEPNAISPNVLGGYAGNAVFAGVKGATIAGGGALLDPVYGLPGLNRISSLGNFCVIGGGSGNFVASTLNTIGGGLLNAISNSANYCVIAAGAGNIITTPVDGGAIVGGFGNTLTIMADLAVIAGGFTNSATNFAAFIGGGGLNLAGGAYSVVVGGTNNRALGASSAVLGGDGNQAAGLQSAVGGGRQNSAGGLNSTVAGGTGNSSAANYTAVGGGFGNTASGQDAVVAGGSQNAATAGQSAVGGGIVNRASGSASTIAGGQQNSTDGFASFIGGGENNILTNNSQWSAVLSGNGNRVTNAWRATILNGESNAVANLADYATVLGGRGVLADKFGQVAFGGRFATNGDAQASLFHLRGTTTGATTGELFLNGTSARLTVPRHSGWSFKALVVGKGINNLSAAAFEVRGLVVNMDGATSVIATTTALGSYSGIAGFSATAVADEVNDALVIRVTSPVGATVRWSAQVETAEVNAPSTLF